MGTRQDRGSPPWCMKQHVKQSLSHPVCCWPRSGARRGYKNTALSGPSNNTHD
ncbi:hypothetical protein AA0482_0619 [Acetobacter cibinongensis NRIC 0482]|nr:hypothetical protein AA0482_0619 [Acetobacter cibinongensis NRIC 0482]